MVCDLADLSSVRAAAKFVAGLAPELAPDTLVPSPACRLLFEGF